MPLFRDIKTPEFLRLDKATRKDTDCTFTPFATATTTTPGSKESENNGM